MSVDEDACSVTVRSAGALRPASGELLGVSFREWRSRLARELGLPDHDLVVGSGHQAELWHPGILSKFVWADELAHRAGAAVVHLLVDTDERDPLAIRAPVVKGQALRTLSHSFGEATPGPMVACRRPAGRPAPIDRTAISFALPCVAEGVANIERALAQSADEPDAAAQAWRAARALLARTAEEPAQRHFDSAPWVRTSQLMQTSLGQALLDRAQQDPQACARAFNAAIELVPRTARPLATFGTGARTGVELPFWVIDMGGSRTRTTSDLLAAQRRSGAPHLLAPAALLTSAIARAALCDRFVHGTGGETYEQATEIFVERWLGARLPAFDTSTATVLLPFSRDDTHSVVTPAQRRSAWFDPEAAFASERTRAGPSREKRALLAAVDAAPRRTAQRRAAWRAMHAHLNRSRGTHAAALADLAAREHADRERAREALVRLDRTWPVSLYPAELITQMTARLRQSH